MDTLISILIYISIIFIELLLGSLALCGVGSLFLYVFNISYVWTFKDAIVIACVIMAFRIAFKGGE